MQAARERLGDFPGEGRVSDGVVELPRREEAETQVGGEARDRIVEIGAGATRLVCNGHVTVT